MSDEWIAVASMAAAAVGTAAVLGQAHMQRQQGRLQAAAAHQQQAEAWASLSSDWKLSVLAAIGDAAVYRQSIPVSDARAYVAAVERYRLARVAWGPVFASDDILSADWDRVADEERAALAGLSPYRHAVQRIVSHLAHVSSLVLKGHIPVGAVYDAFGPQLLRMGEDLLNLVKMDYAHTTSCVGPVHQERELWAQLTAEQLNDRLGWGNVLDIARGTAERIAVLLDILMAYALKMGDLDQGYNAQLPHPAESLASPDRLAIAWRGARPFGRVRAMRILWTLAKAGKATLRRSYWRYPDWLIRRREQRKGVDVAPLPNNGWLLWPRDTLRLPIAVLAAIVRARRVPDVRLVEPPRRVMERIRSYQSEANESVG